MSERHNRTLIFDREGVMERLENDTDLIAILVETYLSDLPRYVQSLKDAVNCGDYSSVAGAAHAIKGSSANIGVILLQEISARIEQECKNKNFEEIKALMPLFYEKYEIVMEFFKNQKANKQESI